MTEPVSYLDDAQRLQAVHGLNLLDTEHEERFDRFTRLAKRLFDVPISLITLLDEQRQWFKSHDGLDASQTPRDIAFCGHAILGDEAFVVNNAAHDTRFCDNPLVNGAPYIRFYAGYPLRVTCGAKVGTLCIIDSQPRPFSASDACALCDLGKTLEKELEALHDTTTDVLTRLTNRRGFLQFAPYLLQFAQRHEQPATLVFLDLDQFKSINDRFGHAEGDRALTTFADIMKTVFRQSDLFARLGGDEFVVLMGNTSPAQSEIALGKLVQQIEALSGEESRGYRLAFSSGIVEFLATRHPAIEALLAEGDALMYAIKRAQLG